MVIDKLSAALKTVLQNKSVVEHFYQAGAQTQWMSPRQFTAYLQKEENTWIPIIKAANIKAN